MHVAVSAVSAPAPSEGENPKGAGRTTAARAPARAGRGPGSRVPRPDDLPNGLVSSGGSSDCMSRSKLAPTSRVGPVGPVGCLDLDLTRVGVAQTLSSSYRWANLRSKSRAPDLGTGHFQSRAAGGVCCRRFRLVSPRRVDPRQLQRLGLPDATLRMLYQSQRGASHGHARAQVRLRGRGPPGPGRRGSGPAGSCRGARGWPGPSPRRTAPAGWPAQQFAEQCVRLAPRPLRASAWTSQNEHGRKAPSVPGRPSCPGG